MEIPQPLWAICGSAWAPPQWTRISWCSDCTFHVSVCVHCLWSCHWAPLKSLALISLHPPFRYTDKIPVQSLLFSWLKGPVSLSLSALQRFSSPFNIAVGLHWTLSSSISLLLWGELDTQFQVWSHQCWVELTRGWNQWRFNTEGLCIFTCNMNVICRLNSLLRKNKLLLW